MCVCIEAGSREGGGGGSWKLAKVLGFLAILCF